MRRLWNKGPFFQEASQEKPCGSDSDIYVGAGGGILVNAPSEVWLARTFKTETMIFAIYLR